VLNVRVKNAIGTGGGDAFVACQDPPEQTPYSLEDFKFSPEYKQTSEEVEQQPAVGQFN
jgi:hypothetical protein